MENDTHGQSLMNKQDTEIVLTESNTAASIFMLFTNRFSQGSFEEILRAIVRGGGASLPG